MNPGKILALSPTALGDTLLCLPALEALRRANPASELIFGVDPLYRPLYDELPLLDRAVDLAVPRGKSVRGIAELLTLSARVRRWRIRIAYLFACTPGYLVPVMKSAGVRQVFMVSNRHRFRWMLTNGALSQDNHWDIGEHGTEDRLRCVRASGIDAPLRAMDLPVQEAWQDEARRWLAGRGLAARPIVVFQASAGLNASTPELPGIHRRHWPKERYAVVAAGILDHHPDMAVVVTGSPGERRAAEELVAMVADPRVVTSAGELSLPGVAGLLSLARMLLTPDTGIMHLGHAVHVPSVCLYSLSETHRTRRLDEEVPHRIVQRGPPGYPDSTPEEVDQCMSFIPTDEVLAACLDVLAETDAYRRRGCPSPEPCVAGAGFSRAPGTHVRSQ